MSDTATHITLSNDNTISSQSGVSYEQPSQHHCRICLEIGRGLLQPCGCRGTVGYVHYECLRSWIELKERLLYTQSLCKEYREIQCEMCRGAIIYQALSVRELSAAEFASKYAKFKTFFIVHTVVLMILAFIVAVLGFLIRHTVQSEQQSSEKVPPLVIESCFLTIAVPSFIKAAHLWVRDFFTKDSILVVDIMQHKVFHWDASEQ